ncbi:MAG: UvrD-helicase domain-containing protein [Clostridia bacterium]|nr:UvrD-helicase domain-containing protein [Clostridia bacterium]
MNKLTEEQRAAVEATGKVIVSASAGSGKTFVMIEKLVRAIEGGADLDNVLAVTFTKKAAAQMKDKLRSALIARLDGADEAVRARLKVQLSKIPSANISTIHSFCAGLLRTYFYVLGIDGGFEIISADDATALDLKARAMDSLFERLYAEEDADFKLLLKCFVKKRSDRSLRRNINEAYNKLRSTAHYARLLEKSGELYCEEGFGAVCREFEERQKEGFLSLLEEVKKFRGGFYTERNPEAYEAIFEEMESMLKCASSCGLFDEKPPLYLSAKPRVTKKYSDDDKAADKAFADFRDGAEKRYDSLCVKLLPREKEKENFLKSGEEAKAFSRVLMQFDREYAAVLREENKLDYNDLEHMTLELLGDSGVLKELNSRFLYVFVDEYQDVNPVQEEIISALGNEVFLVGDVKQAIYGFRGSKSKFFDEKFKSFFKEGKGLKLSCNFRSGGGVLDFVNALFCRIMRGKTCGIDYENDGVMRAGGGYPEGYGGAEIHIFGKEEREKSELLKVYSVKDGLKTVKHTREGLAVLSIVEKELKSKRFDLKTGGLVDVMPSDICVLTRKNKGESVDGIVRALRDEGYSVAGAQEGNICELPEVKQFLDVLSYIDNAEQDYPLISALLSPLGGFCEDELAEIRICFKKEKELSFRACCEKYFARVPSVISKKLEGFYAKCERLRNLAEILTAGGLADELLENCGFEAAYGAGSGEKLKNVLRLVEEGADLTLPAFLEKVKAGGFDIPAPSGAASDSIKVMSMHAAKGLEFPVVIIADVCATFKGQDYSDLPFDEKFGFAPKRHDVENMLCANTVLRRLCKARADDEELKNELNLFYVACTRAMCRLHIMAEEIKPHVLEDFSGARCFADLFDMQAFLPEECALHAEFEAGRGGDGYVFEPDEKLVAEMEKRFGAEYKFRDSVNLPVKSSASAILRAGGDEPIFKEHVLFGGEGETGTERGTAFHRFLELCDFGIKDGAGIAGEIENFLKSGRITDGQAELLNAGELEEILNMPVFADLKGAELFREQEFLCRLPANEILGVCAEDFVLVQGVIDLLARGDFGVKIIDYKYSKKGDAALKETYLKQLKLYKKAVQRILGIAPEKISCTIVNIYLKREIKL